MFNNKTIVKELSRLIDQIKITETYIDFRGKKHLITNGNTITLLTNLLYSGCYMLKEKYQSESLNYPEPFKEDNTDFINLLSQNNQSRETTEPGWKVNDTYPNGYIAISRNNENRITPLSAIKAQDPEKQTVSVFFPKEDRYRQPTFYYAFSNTFIDTSKKLVRIYWNITDKGAPVLLHTITTTLNHYNIPFLFKCLNRPDLYFRRDAAVLYLDDDHMPLMKLILPEIAKKVKNYLEDDVPLFSFRYSKGIGIAENPGIQESFGMNRMTLVAEAVLQATLKQSATDVTILEIAAAFQKKGISPSAPHLNKGSKILFN